MDVDEYTQTIEAMRRSVSTRYGVSLPDLRPPASPERIAGAGELLGVTIPDDLAAMLQAADGGDLFGHGTDFVGLHRYSASQERDSDHMPLVDVTLAARSLIWPEKRFGGEIEYLPGRDFICLTGTGQYGLWYEMSGPNAGSILYFSVQAIEWHVAKVAPSLENLFLAARECTEIYGEFVVADTTEHVFEEYGIDTRINS